MLEQALTRSMILTQSVGPVSLANLLAVLAQILAIMSALLLFDHWFEPYHAAPLAVWPETLVLNSLVD